MVTMKPCGNEDSEAVHLLISPTPANLLILPDTSSLVDELAYQTKSPSTVSPNLQDSSTSLGQCVPLNNSNQGSSCFISSQQISLPDAPDGGWGWVVVVAAFVIHFIGDGIMNSFGVFYTNFVNSFPNTSKSYISMVGALCYGTPAILAPFASAMIKYYGVRPVCMLGGFISGMGCLLAYFVNDIYLLAFTFGFLTGAGQSLCITASLVVVGPWFHKRLAFAYGLSVSGMGVGSFVFPPLLSALLDEYTWRGTMLIIAGLYLNLMVCGALLRPVETKKQYKIRKLNHMENYSRQSGLDLTQNSDYAMCNLDRKIEILKDVLTSKSQLLTLEGKIDQLYTEKEGNICEKLRPPPLPSEGMDKNVTIRESLPVGDDMEDEADIKELRQNCVNISFVRDIPYSGTYRLCLYEPCLATIQEDELLDTNQNDADANSLIGKSSYDLYSCFIDLSNPSLVNEPLSRSGRSLCKSSDTMDTKTLAPSMRCLAEERLSKSLDCLLLLDESEKSNSSDDFQGVIRAKSDPEMVLFKSSISSRLTDLISGDGLEPAPSKLRYQFSEFEPDVNTLHIIPSRMNSISNCNETLKTIIEAQGWAQIMRDTVDFSVLANWKYSLFFISNLLLFIWGTVSIFYLGHWATLWGMNEENASFLFSAFGVSNTVGQIVIGWLADRSRVNVVLLYSVLIGIMGVCTCLVPWCKTFVPLVLYATVYGITMAANDALTSVVVVELLGRRRITTGIGVIFFGQGIGFLTGPPFLGYLYDVTGRYQICFFLSGIFITISGLIILPILIPRRGTHSAPASNTACPSTVGIVVSDSELASVTHLPGNGTANGSSCPTVMV